MAWIITKVHDESCADEVGTMGPRTITPENETYLRSGKGIAFKLYDDDNTLIYEGRITPNAYESAPFQPLDQFGMPNYGCTSIRYREYGTRGKFVTI